MKRISIAITDSMYDDLSERAARREIGVSELLRRAASLYRVLDDHAGKPVFIGEGAGRLQVVTPDLDTPAHKPNGSSNGEEGDEESAVSKKPPLVSSRRRTSAKRAS